MNDSFSFYLYDSFIELMPLAALHVLFIAHKK